jgi:hypothetical protein
MKRFAFLAACFLVCVLVAGSSAEIYRRIIPYSTLGDVKKLFPGATFNKMHPAWAQETDVMYKIDGVGIQGLIIIKFDDSRPTFKKMEAEAADNNAQELWKSLANESEEDGLGVSWVRWVLDTPFSVDRLITKYGKPEKSDFSQEDFQPYKEWTSRGIAANLSDDGKKVMSIEFQFTPKEMKDAWNKKFGVYKAPSPQEEATGKKGKKGKKK